MDSRDHAVVEVLKRLDPVLGGLFERGVLLADHVDDPEVPLLLGHIGRELSKATLALVAQEVPVSEGLPKEATQDPGLRERLCRAAGLPPGDDRVDRMIELLGDGQRAVVARALALRPEHPLVSSWLKLHRELVSITHYRPDARPPEPERARAAFRQLASLLYYRVGPYFDTEEDLERLLSTTEPDEDSLRQLRELLVRPRLRIRFFAALSQPGWLEPLLELGVFDHAPEWQELPDGRFQFVPWPEGECLARLAGLRPNTVGRALLSLDERLKNPVVWDIVARSIVEVPPSIGRRLGALLCRSLRHSDFRGFRHNITDGALHLARAGEKVARRLTRLLLGTRPLPYDDSEERTLWFRRNSEDLLEHLDGYEFEQFLSAIVDPLLEHDAEQAWSLFIDRLRRASQVAEESGFADSHLSQHWCDFSDVNPRDDDVRAALAKVSLEACLACLVAEPRTLTPMLEALDREQFDVFSRLRLLVLAWSGIAPGDMVDQIVADPRTLDPAFGASEVAEFLRACFGLASQESKDEFRAHLERGPDLVELRSMAEWRGEDADDPIALQEVVRDWQRKRLRWFHDFIPEELSDLAADLGVAGVVPTARDRALDEVGFYSGGVSWRGEFSPLNEDAVSSMSAEELLDYLRGWRPDPAEHDGPSRRGLADILRDTVAHGPMASAELLEGASRAEGLHPSYSAALLAGLRRAIEADLAVPWPAALGLAERTVRDAQTQAGEGATEWLWARGEAVELVSSGCGKDLIDLEFSDTVLGFTDYVVETSPGWPSSEFEDSAQFGQVVQAVLNADAGKSTNLLVAVALWGYRAAGEEWVRDRVRVIDSMLDSCISREDHGVVSASARIGSFLPQLLLLRPAWVDENADALFSDGMTRPLEKPAFGAYLVLSRHYPTSFEVMLPWLIQHVESLEVVREMEDSSPGNVGDWSIVRHFLEKVGLAYIQGLITLTDSERLVEKAFAAVRPSDRGHFYWQLYRAWSDAEEQPPSEYIGRVVALWQWRLETRDENAVDQVDEDEGLAWLFLTPFIPGEDLLRLGAPTLSIQRKRHGTRSLVWPRLAQLLPLDTPAVIKLTEEVVNAELAGEWPHFNTEDLFPLLRAGLRSDDAETQERAQRIIHALGDRGWTEFGGLLRE